MLLMAMLFVSLTYAQIISTTAGGNWNDASTWLGGVVPTVNDDVVIDGTVFHSNKEDVCKTLTVNVEKTLTSLNPSVNGWPLKIMGDLINNGNLRDNDAGDWLQISVNGNIINNGVWQITV